MPRIPTESREITLLPSTHNPSEKNGNCVPCLKWTPAEFFYLDLGQYPAVFTAAEVQNDIADLCGRAEENGDAPWREPHILGELGGAAGREAGKNRASAHFHVSLRRRP